MLAAHGTYNLSMTESNSSAQQTLRLYDTPMMTCAGQAANLTVNLGPRQSARCGMRRLGHLVSRHV